VKAIIIVGAYGPVTKFIKYAKQEFPEAIYLNVSFVGSTPLLENMISDIGDTNIIVSQIIPPISSDLPAINGYKEDLKKI
jgi:branched-chain amino acid transport system substrate-binding protein